MVLFQGRNFHEQLSASSSAFLRKLYVPVIKNSSLCKTWARARRPPESVKVRWPAFLESQWVDAAGSTKVRKYSFQSGLVIRSDAGPGSLTADPSMMIDGYGSPKTRVQEELDVFKRRIQR
ncbi:hypothetical protein H4Q26_008284 [Puccinia striiformis f. sp. tritici PST-130]|nr:hypothetical protein H4Q26_008284 [Puccinia striiformis f. sp. tritici PST-130]